MAFSMSATMLALALTCFGHSANGNAFLSKIDETARLTELLNGSTIKQLLLNEVAGFTGKGQKDLDLPEIERALEPMWLALPKNSYGNLDKSQVQYAIHRYFVQRHGWAIDGLDKVGAESNASSAFGGVLRERTSAFLMEVFEEALGTTGLKLHELSIFAATLEHIIHGEVTGRLQAVYTALATPETGLMNEGQVNTAVDAFLMSLIMGENVLKKKGPLDVQFQRLDKMYPGWKLAKQFLRGVQEEVTYSDETSNDIQLNFAQVEDIVEEVSHRFGTYQDHECHHLKDTLLQAEEGNSGRVTLSNFYKKGLEANVLFKENVDYLRQQGALDESKPGEPRVIVPNFILSPGNCLADTGFYSICCINECEGLLSQLERAIAAPEGTPEQIVSTVQTLSSSSVEGPRVLSARLVSQIELVAMRHGGKVPLHSRSLAQWLHVAFPHECPYPHTAAVTSSLTTSEMRANQAGSKLDADARMQYIESVAPVEEEAVQAEEELLSKWSHEEEILYKPVQKPSALWRLASAGMKTMLGLALVACAFAAVTDMVRRSGGMSVKGGRGMSPMFQAEKESHGKLV